MQRLEVSGVVRHIYASLGFKGLIPLTAAIHWGEHLEQLNRHMASEVE